MNHALDYLNFQPCIIGEFAVIWLSWTDLLQENYPNSNLKFSFYFRKGQYIQINTYLLH